MANAKILLVDDTRLVLELEKSFLKLSHVEVMTASNGVEALELIRLDPPDLIFMDINMPIMDGVECCAQLKADPFLCDIPVVMLTTAGKDSDRERAKNAGCDDFITKPIDRREFLGMARKFTQAVDRRELRVPCQLPVLFLLDQSPVSAYALDVCDGGVFLATHQTLPQEELLKLALYLPAPAPVLMEMTGRVAWVNEEGRRVHTGLPAGFGVEFLDLEEREITKLKCFLEAESQDLPGPGVR